jgi:hypothetical protein
MEHKKLSDVSGGQTNLPCSTFHLLPPAAAVATLLPSGQIRQSSVSPSFRLLPATIPHPLLPSSCNELGHLCAPSAATKLMGTATIRAHRRHSASLRRRYRLVTLIYAAHCHHHPAGSSNATHSFVAHARSYLAAATRAPRDSAVFGCRSLASKQRR